MVAGQLALDVKCLVNTLAWQVGPIFWAKYYLCQLMITTAWEEWKGERIAMYSERLNHSGHIIVEGGGSKPWYIMLKLYPILF